MKAEIINLLSPTSKPAILVSHGDGKLEFRISSFTTKPFPRRRRIRSDQSVLGRT
jgi:hypothetical protein